MNRIAVLAGAAALGLAAPAALGYNATANVTFSWGGNGGGVASVGSPIAPGAVDTASDIGWTSGGTNALSAISNSTYFSQLGGYNARSYYNADFASTANCAVGGGVVPLGATALTRRKYGCRFSTYSGTPEFGQTPVTDAAAALSGASASGTITVTDTTLTGTLTINATTDEPTGASTTFSPTGARLSNSAGNGTNGYNYRSADGSPFGNYWQGVTTAGTYQLNLTGTFSSSAWNITGGAATFTDTGFACQQGGLGATSDNQAGTLCTRSAVSGGQQYNGAGLSWGVDLDGAGTGSTVAGMIDVRDAGGTTTLATLSGVLASLSISGGNIVTDSGEFRRAIGSGGGGCADHIRYQGTGGIGIGCGTLTVGQLAITGTVVPVPGAVWLLGSALGVLGWLRRRVA